MDKPKSFDFTNKLEGPYGTAALVLSFIAISLIKMKPFISGRFWGEEGAVFYKNIGGEPSLANLLFLFNGHLEIVTNFVVYASSFTKLIYAPIVTTYLSLFFQAIPVLLLIFYRRQMNLSFFAMSFFLVVLAGLSQSAEVWANSINLHFHFAFLAALILVIPIADKYPKYLFRFLLLLSGLSGIPANFLAPLFLMNAFLLKDRERIVHAAIIFSTAALQIVLLMTNSNDADARISADPIIIWLAIIAQQIISPVSSFIVADHLSALLQGVLSNNLGALIFAIICTLPLFYFLKIAFSVKNKQILTLIGATILLSVFSIIASLGEKIMLISASSGGRYFFAPNVLMVLTLLIVASRVRGSQLKVYFAILLVVSVSKLNHSHLGKPWKDAFNEARAQGSETIEIWPFGWRMPVPLKGFNQ